MSAPKQFSVWDLITFPARCLAGCVTLRCLGTTASPRWAAELVIHKSCEQGRQRWSHTSHLTWRNQTKAHQKHFYSKIRGRASLIGGEGIFFSINLGWEKEKDIRGVVSLYSWHPYFTISYFGDVSSGRVLVKYFCVCNRVPLPRLLQESDQLWKENYLQDSSNLLNWEGNYFDM